MIKSDFSKYHNESSPFERSFRKFLFFLILIIWIVSVMLNNTPLALIGGFLVLDWILSEIKYNLYELRKKKKQ